jgi:hypothetical protein
MLVILDEFKTSQSSPTTSYDEKEGIVKRVTACGTAQHGWTQRGWAAQHSGKFEVVTRLSSHIFTRDWGVETAVMVISLASSEFLLYYTHRFSY